jgi:HAD superfamily hydrolase (TIGR01493 family)
MMAGGAAIDGVLFDFGNTLFAHSSLAATVSGVARSLGQHLSAGEAEDVAARIDALAADPAEAAHPRDLDAAVWAARWRAFYAVADDCRPGLGAGIYESMHAPRAWRPFADTSAVLHGLRDRGVRVGVVSNTGWDVRAVLAAHGLLGLVHSFTLSYEVGAVKPELPIFVAAVDALGCPPRTVMMVGDDPVADAGAARAGLRTMLLPPVPVGGDNGLRAVLDLVDGGRSARDRRLTR